MVSSMFLWLLLVGPAAIAVALLVLAIWLIVASGAWSKGGRVMAWAGAVLCLGGMFGIGACYAMMMNGGRW